MLFASPPGIGRLLLPPNPRPPLPFLSAPAAVQMGLGVGAVVLGGVGIPVVAVQLQFWKAKG